MPSVYPAAPTVRPAPKPFDEVACADALVAVRAAEPDITKVRAAGRVIHATGGTVADVYRVWCEVEAERVLWRSVSPADHATATSYKAALVGDYLDVDVWYDGLKAEKGVTTFADLVDAVTPEVIIA